jgi:phage terminase large subunit GpA-like protein
VLIGEPTDPEVWQDLKELYQSHWEHESGAKLKPAMMCVDSGAWSKVVYEWVKSMRDRAIVPIKGSSNFSADALTGTDRDRRKRSTKRLANGRPAEMIGVSQIKLLIQRQLAAPQGKHGYCHFPTGRSREYFDQLTGERLMIEQKRGKRPTRAWVKVHSAVEALDCRVYAYAALLLSGVDLEKEATNILIEKPATPVQKKPTTVSRRQQVRSRLIR